MTNYEIETLGNGAICFYVDVVVIKVTCQPLPIITPVC